MHQHLTLLNQIYQSETQPFRKVHRMIDLFESIIKSHTVVILGEYVKHNKLSDAAKGMLAQGLRTPSLGTWQLFSRVMFEELQADGFAWSFADFPAEFSALDKALNTDKTNVIAFRNGYAHGATPTDEQCQADIKKFDPFLNLLMQSKWLADSVLEPRNGKVWVVGNSAVVCVHPVLLHKPDGGDASYAFFNDLKNDKVGLLNYPLSKHYREKEFYKEFHEILPLHEWKKSGNNEFYQRIEELTETFKGRTKERERLLQFVLNNHKGYMSIQGNPGIGKSALIAQFFKDLRAHKEMANVQVVEYFIRRGTAQAQVEYVFNYLLRRTDELFPAGREIRAEGKAVWDLQYQLFSKWRLWGEQCEGRKLLFLIDGLDEGTENSVVTYMPRENFEHILIIYGSRPGGHKSIDELWATLPVEHHAKMELSGLSKEDIRALIYDVANKYEVERESAWIDAVQQRSQGNPLYLKLLCDAIEHGSIALNDIQALPDKIDEYYKAILNRYANDPDGDALLAGLFAFAAARDYLTMAHLGLINKLGDATVQRIGSTLKEVLYENPLTEEVLDYQLFHESFREYLAKEKAGELRNAAERIMDFCADWKELGGSWEQRYALEHYAAHLSASPVESRHHNLIQLIYDTSYINEQKKVLQHFDASNTLYRLALQKANALKRDADALEAALCLVDLKYEEANDAPQVVALVACGDIDLALKRIESFGGSDEEGVKRKFMLYMLCLMELTLLGSKGKVYRKTAIEKLLNHLDEQIPPDTSVINWNEFFPSYLIFQMACGWAELGLDYLIVYKRTNDFEIDWLLENGLYNKIQLKALLECAWCIKDDTKKCFTLSYISTELARQGKINEATSVIMEAFVLANGISDDYLKCSVLVQLSAELAKQSKDDEAASTMQEALSCARHISTESVKSSVLKDISTELMIQGQVEAGSAVMLEALAYARGISDDYLKCSVLVQLSAELVKQARVEDGSNLIQEALACALDMSDGILKNITLVTISTELAKQGKLEEALALASCINDHINDHCKNIALVPISAELAKRGKLEEAFGCTRDITSESVAGSALRYISTELAKQGKFEEALSCARGISAHSNRSSALKDISTELAKKGKLEEAAAAMQEALPCARGISDVSGKSSALMQIATELAKQGKADEALACAQSINEEPWKSSALRDTLTELAKQGKVEEALSCARGISDVSGKSSALMQIASELAKKGQVEEGASAILDALACAREINDDFIKEILLNQISAELAKQGKVEEALACAQSINEPWKSSALTDILTELAKQGKLDEVLAFLRGIGDESVKSSVQVQIASELAKQGKIEEAVSAIQESLACAGGISDESEKSRALKDISAELAKQGKLEDALSCTGGISDDSDKSSALKDISSELAKQGHIDEAASAMQEALSCARGISSNSNRSSALKDISTELAKQGKMEEAASAMQESLACAGGISDDRIKSIALKDISAELAKQGHWSMAEQVGLEIPQLAECHACWKALAANCVAQNGAPKALQQADVLQNEEARLFYLKGWVEAIKLQDANTACVQEALSHLANDSESIEALLQKHALQEVFFGNASRETINRFNHALNIQWALDIAMHFPKADVSVRLSTNLDAWLHEIEDEDDRDEIELLAKKVAKGKMSEEEFAERVKGMG